MDGRQIQIHDRLTRARLALEALLAGHEAMGDFLRRSDRSPHCCDPFARARQCTAVALVEVKAALSADGDPGDREKGRSDSDGGAG